MYRHCRVPNVKIAWRQTKAARQYVCCCSIILHTKAATAIVPYFPVERYPTLSYSS